MKVNKESLTVKAGAIQLTLTIAIIIALLLSAFILLVNLHKRFRLQTNFTTQTITDATNGIQYALTQNLPLKDTVTLNLNPQHKFATVKVHRTYWGVFQKVTSTSTIKNKQFTKVAFTGGKQQELNKTALYLQDNNKPLVVVGNTKISGKVYLPRQGVKPGTIAGQSYNESQLIYGNIKTSDNLPKLPKEVNDIIEQVHNNTNTNDNNYLELEFNKAYTNSFLSPTKVVFNNTPIKLSEVKLTGNIKVKSNSKIIVDASTKLEDVILVAPEIEIRANVKGNFQAIATKRIVVDKNVQLDYPSALVLSEKKSSESDNSKSGISIENGVIIKGEILFLGFPKQNNFDIQLNIKPNSKVYGDVYCNQNLELAGYVFGTVFTNNFIAKQSGSLYQNYIYNGVIDVNALKDEFVGLTILNREQSVIKWLY